MGRLRSAVQSAQLTRQSYQPTPHVAAPVQTETTNLDEIVPVRRIFKRFNEAPPSSVTLQQNSHVARVPHAPPPTTCFSARSYRVLHQLTRHQVRGAPLIDLREHVKSLRRPSKIRAGQWAALDNVHSPPYFEPKVMNALEKMRESFESNPQRVTPMRKKFKTIGVPNIPPAKRVCRGGQFAARPSTAECEKEKEKEKKELPRRKRSRTIIVPNLSSSESSRTLHSGTNETSTLATQVLDNVMAATDHAVTKCDKPRVRRKGPSPTAVEYMKRGFECPNNEGKSPRTGNFDSGNFTMVVRKKGPGFELNPDVPFPHTGASDHPPAHVEGKSPATIDVAEWNKWHTSHDDANGPYLHKVGPSIACRPMLIPTAALADEITIATSQDMDTTGDVTMIDAPIRNCCVPKATASNWQVEKPSAATKNIADATAARKGNGTNDEPRVKKHDSELKEDTDMEVANTTVAPQDNRTDVPPCTEKQDFELEANAEMFLSNETVCPEDYRTYVQPCSKNHDSELKVHVENAGSDVIAGLEGQADNESFVEKHASELRVDMGMAVADAPIGPADICTGVPPCPMQHDSEVKTNAEMAVAKAAVGLEGNCCDIQPYVDKSGLALKADMEKAVTAVRFGREVNGAADLPCPKNNNGELVADIEKAASDAIVIPEDNGSNDQACDKTLESAVEVGKEKAQLEGKVAPDLSPWDVSSNTSSNTSSATSSDTSTETHPLNVVQPCERGSLSAVEMDKPATSVDDGALRADPRNCPSSRTPRPTPPPPPPKVNDVCHERKGKLEQPIGHSRTDSACFRHCDVGKGRAEGFSDKTNVVVLCMFSKDGDGACGSCGDNGFHDKIIVINWIQRRRDVHLLFSTIFVPFSDLIGRYMILSVDRIQLLKFNWDSIALQ